MGKEHTCLECRNTFSSNIKQYNAVKCDGKRNVNIGWFCDKCWKDMEVDI